MSLIWQPPSTDKRVNLDLNVCFCDDSAEILGCYTGK